jgi:hypothetical protein
MRLLLHYRSSGCKDKKNAAATGRGNRKKYGGIDKSESKGFSKQDKDNPKNDRLMLNEQRIKNIADSIRQVSKLPNPSGKILEKKTSV